ncbi:MAG: thioredoxin family protein [Actinomycetota bacterium]
MNMAKRSYEKMFRKAEGTAGERKNRNGSRARERLTAALVILALLPYLFLADCGCGERTAPREDAPMKVQAEEREAGDQPPQGYQATSPSQEAIEAALKAGIPVFLNFHSDRCIPCIEMEKIIEEVRPEYEGRVAFVVVDVYDPAEMPLCDYFKVRVIPTSFFIRADGVVVDGYEGLLSAPEMRSKLDGLLAGQG